MTRILIADSGSTKTEWKVLKEGEAASSHFSEGINPFYEDSDDIVAKLRPLFQEGSEDVDQIFFYGAGCANTQKKDVVRKALNTLSPSSKIEVENDLLAAARALCGNTAGIACILGTGSNSCYYDGQEVRKNVSPLGYILGDEGSGAILGKLLISDLLKNQLPDHLERSFFNSYQLSPADIIDSVYRQPYPNRFLAQFSKFVKAHLHHSELKNLVTTNFEAFVERNLLQYAGVKNTPVHFVGSVAYHFQEELTKVLQQYQIPKGRIFQAPMEGLVDYHLSSASHI